MATGLALCVHGGVLGLLVVSQLHRPLLERGLPDAPVWISLMAAGSEAPEKPDEAPSPVMEKPALTASTPKPLAPGPSQLAPADPLPVSVRSQPELLQSSASGMMPSLETPQNLEPGSMMTPVNASASRPTGTGQSLRGHAEAGSEGRGPTAVPMADSDAYALLVRAYIDRHKRVPDNLVTESVQGAVDLAFVLDRDGQVRLVKVIKGSGHPALDAAAIEMIQTLTPLPAAPASETWRRRRFVMTLTFRPDRPPLRAS